MTADEIIEAARAELGTPFVHQGRLPGKALDCAGLAVVVASHWYTVSEPRAYGRSPHEGLLRIWVEDQHFIEPSATPEPGGVLLMRFGKEPQHLAICAGDTIIHSYGMVGKVVEHRFSDVWRARVAASYRFAGVTA
jgi:cell wall-associated NlpC family hydrolase